MYNANPGLLHAHLGEKVHIILEALWYVDVTKVLTLVCLLNIFQTCVLIPNESSI